MSKHKTDVHQIINKHRLPLHQNGKPIVDLLKEKYIQIYTELHQSVSGDDLPKDFSNQFYTDLKVKILPVFKEISVIIVDILERSKGSPTPDYSCFDMLMKRLCDEKALRILKIEDGLMSRIRKGTGPFERKDLFHISNNAKNKVTPQRYNRRNEPCLYLSCFPGLHLSANEMVLLSWQECNAPLEFYVAFYMIQEPLHFLHLAKKGTSYLYEYDDAVDLKWKTDRETAIKQYLYTLPLRLACSIENDNKSKSVADEDEVYLIPQMLMDWVKRCDGLHGIAYTSSLGNSNIKTLWSYNLAMPVRKPDLIDGYDEDLKRIFKLSQPIKCDLSRCINELAEIGANSKGYSVKLTQSFTNGGSKDDEHLLHFLDVGRRFEQICRNAGEDTSCLLELLDLRNEVKEKLVLFEHYSPDTARDIMHASYQIIPHILTLNSQFEYEYL